MRQLNFDLKTLQARHREGAFGTRRDRSYVLDQAAHMLHELGFRRLRATGLKRKHVNTLVAEWQRRGLAVGTRKNRMSALRWWAERVGRPGVVGTNVAHGIGERRYVTHVPSRTPADFKYTPSRRGAASLKRWRTRRGELTMKQLMFAVVAVASLAGCGNLKEVRLSVEDGDKKRSATVIFQSLTVTQMPMRNRWDAVCKALLDDEHATFEQARETTDTLEGTCRIADKP